ncbi:MAG: AzlC family ABC transporter permease [Firmicutes bacterium]|nr:AzlC family ABC transporter permease [Bacillota bacterium]
MSCKTQHILLKSFIRCRNLCNRFIIFERRVFLLSRRDEHILAAKAAFPHTIPILTGFLFLGIAYGILMNVSGFHPIYPILMSIVVFSGTAQFIAVNLLVGSFDPLGAFLLMLMTGARHIFYGISMLEKYKVFGLKKYYLIYTLCDETFSINCTIDAPAGVNKELFMTYVSFFDQLYWVVGTAIGALFGTLVEFNVEGLDFVMTALIAVLFLEQLLKEKNYLQSFIGVGCAVLCLVIFGAEGFLVPAMLMILAVLTFIHKKEESAGKTV